MTEKVPGQAWSAIGVPAPATPLVGREAEVDAVLARLRDPQIRIVTLTGPGGVGKTRVALEAAASAGDYFTDGVVFVALAAVRDADVVASTVAQRLGLRSVGGQSATDVLHDYLGPRELLLVLDSFEHVIEAAALPAALVASCSGLKLMITSRETLNLSGENELHVPPLQERDAVAVFCQRAHAANPDFALTDDNARAVAEICARLNGLPLALELAASRARLLAPETILSRLELGLDLLTRGARDLPARQRTMRSAIQWSYDLLDGPEQRLFRHLCVCVGGCSLDAAAALSDAAGGPPVDALDTVSSLLEKNMLYRVEDRGGDPRLGILDTIREYGLEALQSSGEFDSAQRAHAAHYLALAEEAAPKLGGAEKLAWLDRLEADHGNLRAALRHAVDNRDSATGLRFAAALGRFWYLRAHHTEGLAWLDEALALGHSEEIARVRALYAACILGYHRGEYARAQARGEEGLELARRLGDERGVALSLEGLGLVARATGRYDEARVMYGESIAICRRLGDRRQLAEGLMRISVVFMFEADYEAAHSACAEATAIMRELGDRDGLAYASTSHAVALLGSGDSAGARATLEAAMAEIPAIGTWRWSSRLQCNLGVAAARQGDYVVARTHLEEAAAISLERGEPMYAAVCLSGLAHVLIAGEKRHDLAARLLGAADATRDALGGAVPQFVELEAEADRAAARRALGEKAFAAAYAEGRAMTLEHALASLPPAAADAAQDLPEGLTARELEVLRLVAMGGSDADVAEALVVSRRTVHAHLRSIYRKLDVRSRSAATRYALEHGLA